MITDLRELREALAIKNLTFDSIRKKIREVRQGAYRRRATACDKQRVRLLKQLEKVTRRRDEWIAEDLDVRRNYHAYVRKLRKARDEVHSLRFLCGVISDSATEQEKRKLQRSGAETRADMKSGGDLDGMTWRFLGRILKAIRADDDEELDRLAMELVDLMELADQGFDERQVEVRKPRKAPRKSQAEHDLEQKIFEDAVDTEVKELQKSLPKSREVIDLR